MYSTNTIPTMVQELEELAKDTQREIMSLIVLQRGT